MRRESLFFLAAAIAPALSFAAAGNAPDYNAHIVPLFEQFCVDCHGADDPDGGFALDTFAGLMKGGEEGPAIIAGKSTESPLVMFLEGKSGRGGKNEFMPPGKRKKLGPEQVALVKAWIDAGAKGPSLATAPAPKVIVTPKIAPAAPLKRSIHAVAFSSQVQLLAVARYGEVELINPVTRAVVRKLTGFTGKINAVAFSSDGAWVYAAGGEPGITGGVRSWKTADGAAVATYAGHTDACYALALSPDGKTLSTGSYDQKIKLWDAGSGREIVTLKGHNGAVNGLAFRPDGKVLASASADRTIKLWSVPDGARLDTLSQPTKEQQAVVFSADGKTLFAAGADNRIRAWSISAKAVEGSNVMVTSRYAHEGGILNLTLAADGKLLASSATDQSLKLWNAADLQEKLAIEKQPDWAPAVVFADKSRLVVGRVDGTLAIYNAANGSVMAAPKPAKPEVSGVSPRAIHIGGNVMVTVAGKNLDENMQVRFSHSALSAEVRPASVKPSTATFVVRSNADLPRGSYDMWVTSAGGESAKMKLHADELPPTVTTAGSFAKGPVVVKQLPASLWGTLSEVGQHDRFRFNAKAGEELVLDLAVQQVGSAAKTPTLEILDAAGKVMAVNRGLSSGSDPFLAWTAPAGGAYEAVISNTTMDGSANHVYRLTIGALPFVTGWLPLTAQAGKAVDVTLIGHHLGTHAKAKAEPGAEGMFAVPIDAKALRFRTPPMLRVNTLPQALEMEPNDGAAEAQLISLPATVNARLHSASSKADTDHFAFEARAGEEWVIETFAAAAGSPADTKIEILDASGNPVPRMLLQSVRDSYNNFRSVDANNPDIRLQNWEEMELNEYVHFNGDVMRIFRMPRGPDSGTLFYSSNGMRRAYFDTSATDHPLDEPCYVVEPKPLGTTLVPNGLPVFTLNYSNDDAGDRKSGRDSKLTFTAPADGRYVIRITDTRGWSGERFVYALSARRPQPDFSIKLAGAGLTVSPGASMGFSFRADRRDGFDGPILIEIEGLPQGYHATSPLIIEAGHDLVSGSLHAAADATAGGDWSQVRITATATADGQTLRHEAGGFGKVALGAAPQFVIILEPDAGGKPAMRPVDPAAPLEISLTPGRTTKAWLRAVRSGNNGLINLDLHGLPHGVIIDDIGLNGVQIREKESERPISLRAAKWVQPQEKLCHAALSSARAEHDSAGLQTSVPVRLKIVPAAEVSSR